jgi:hypothetical protein
LWWCAHEYEAMPNIPAHIEVQGEIVLDAPQSEEELLPALRALFSEVSLPLSGRGCALRQEGGIRGHLRARHY